MVPCCLSDSETEYGGSQSDAGGVPPPAASLTLNSPNAAPQDTDSEHNKYVNVDINESDSSRQGERNKSSHSDKDVRPSTTTEQEGSKGWLERWVDHFNPGQGSGQQKTDKVFAEEHDRFADSDDQKIGKGVEMNDVETVNEGVNQKQKTQANMSMNKEDKGR